MPDPVTVFDDITTFCADRIEAIGDRPKSDLLLVSMDVIRDEPAEQLTALQPSASGRLNVHWVTGTGDPLRLLLGFGPESSPDGKHPVDEAIDAGIADDAVVVIYAGVMEWESDLALTKRVRQRLPKASLTVMACTCARERKIEALASFAKDLPGVSLAFTPECGGEATMETLAGIFLAVV